MFSWAARIYARIISSASRPFGVRRTSASRSRTPRLAVVLLALGGCAPIAAPAPTPLPSRALPELLLELTRFLDAQIATGG